MTKKKKQPKEITFKFDLNSPYNFNHFNELGKIKIQPEDYVMKKPHKIEEDYKIRPRSDYGKSRKGVTFTGVVHKTIKEADAYMNGFRDGALNTKPTLRQYYAGMALQGLIIRDGRAYPEGNAESAFIAADAMIKWENENL